MTLGHCEIRTNFAIHHVTLAFTQNSLSTTIPQVRRPFYSNIYILHIDARTRTHTQYLLICFFHFSLGILEKVARQKVEPPS